MDLEGIVRSVQRVRAAYAVVFLMLLALSPLIPPKERQAAARSTGDLYTIQACRTFTEIQPRSRLADQPVLAALEARAQFGSDKAVFEAIINLRMASRNTDSRKWEDAVWEAGYACMVWATM